MNGDAHNNETVPDRVDGMSAEEFVVEDIVDGEERLSSLFDASGGDVEEHRSHVVGAAEPGLDLADESDALFRVGAEVSAPALFGSDDGASAFSEDGESSPSWDGEGLELDDGPGRGPADSDHPLLAEAADNFAVELSSMLDDVEDFALDSDVELEVVSSDSESTPGAPEMFLLDDSEGLLGLGDAAISDAGELATGEVGADAAAAFGLAASSDVNEQGDACDDLRDISDDAAGMSGWAEPEALNDPRSASLAGGDDPRDAVDERGSVGEVDPAALGHAAAAASQPGHDIYADEAPSTDVIGGPAPPRGRVARAALCAAAAVFVCVGVAVLVWPAGLDGGGAPVGVERVELVRPRVEVPIGAPPRPASSVSAGRDERPAARGVAGEVVAAPNGVTADDATRGEPRPSARLGDAGGADLGEQPAANAGAGPEPVIDAEHPRAVAPAAQPLARFGERLLVGDLGAAGGAGGAALAGVRPGQRAFAQLRNGNYFIGRVKRVSADEVTLRVDTGEVTLLRRDLAQLTRLGSAERHAVEEAAQGSVRLTNDNRLVGGILQRIEDDVIVLEVRQNRVVLPASAVGEIVEGDERGGVRLGTTGAEEQWLRERAERELKSGEGAKRSAAKRPPTVGSERR